jgi:hypothetical protein
MLSSSLSESTHSSSAFQARRTQRMNDSIRMIHNAWGTGTFSDAEFGTGAGCSVYADADFVAALVADDMMSLSTNISCAGGVASGADGPMF